MATTADIPRLEMLQVADMVAREKGIEREEVLEAMEQAIQKAGRAKYGLEHDIRAEIDRKTGEIKLLRYMQVADPIENENTQVPLAEAQRRNPEAQVGDFLTDELPPIDFGRVAAQTAKQVITQRMRESERKRQYEEFKDRVGEIVSGVVKRVDYGNITVDLQRAEGVIRRDETIPRESLRVNDRVRAYIFDVREEPRGPQIFLSRSHPQFMAKLFMQEVPEIYDNIIEIKAVARDPGSRAKIAVLSHDSSIDPIGACVGMRGSRVQAVVQELQGEKVDIIPWSNDTANFIVNALAPAEVSKVLMDEEKHKTEVVVPDDQLSLAIGRRGQNVKLASQLTGWEIDIMTETEESERRQKETRERTELFKASLDVDDVIAHLLVAEGYGAVEDIAESAVEDLAGVEGFDQEIATDLQPPPPQYITNRHAELATRLEELGIDEAVRSTARLTVPMLVALGEKAGPERMIRFVVGPQGDGVPDLARRLRGRGMWVRAERAAVERAVAKNLFAKSAKAAVRPAADLPERVERLLLERALSDLGRARRAGRAVAGFVRVEQMIGQRRAGLLIVAHRAGRRGLGQPPTNGPPR